MSKSRTAIEFEQVLAACRTIFSAKLKDYGASWRIMRIPSVTDQIFIKACRLRSLQEKGQAQVDESPTDAFTAIVNYGLIGLIQMTHPPVLEPDFSEEEALKQYDEWAQQAYQLMLRKNHDYGEAWRGMHVESYVDLILMKLYRIKQIEAHGGHTQVSEGIDANYMDMINYAIFGLIKLTCE